MIKKYICIISFSYVYTYYFIISFSCPSPLHSKVYRCVKDLCKMFLLGIITFVARCFRLGFQYLNDTSNSPCSSR